MEKKRRHHWNPLIKTFSTSQNKTIFVTFWKNTFVTLDLFWPLNGHDATRSQRVNIKETVRGGRVAEMSAHSIQRCDWPTWRSRARTANHSAESSGPTFRLLFLLSRSPWPLSSILYPGNISIGLTAISRLIQIHNRTKFRPCVHLVCLFIWNSPLNLICFLNRFCKSQFGYWISYQQPNIKRFLSGFWTALKDGQRKWET